jgi:hypothetical protein
MTLEQRKTVQKSTRDQKQPSAPSWDRLQEFIVYSAGLVFTLVIAWYCDPSSLY